MNPVYDTNERNKSPRCLYSRKHNTIIDDTIIRDTIICDPMTREKICISNRERNYLLRYLNIVGFKNNKDLSAFLDSQSTYKKIPCKHGIKCRRNANRTCAFGHGEYDLIRDLIIKFRENEKKKTKAFWQQKMRSIWGANYSIDAPFRSILGISF